MAALLDHSAAMSSSYLHLLTGGMPQYGAAVGLDMDGWDQQSLDPTPFLGESNQDDQAPAVEVSDYMCFEDDDDDVEAPLVVAPDTTGGSQIQAAGACGSRLDASGLGAAVESDSSGAAVVAAGDGGGPKRKKEGAAVSSTRKRIGFRTKSEVDVLDDGYKWRKYGKKSVKNSPNPRNYYKCSYQGCDVKKRVERDSEDASYVLTIYEGVHNHTSPASAAYFVHNSLHSTPSTPSWLSPGGGWPSSNSNSSSGSWDMNTVQFSFS